MAELFTIGSVGLSTTGSVGVSSFGCSGFSVVFGSGCGSVGSDFVSSVGSGCVVVGVVGSAVVLSPVGTVGSVGFPSVGVFSSCCTGVLAVGSVGGVSGSPSANPGAASVSAKANVHISASALVHLFFMLLPPRLNYGFSRYAGFSVNT